MREPIVAGQFYSFEKSQLQKELENCFEKPGLPGKRKKQALLGIISPHAGYLYSGPTAAFAYKEIAESDFPDTFVILGVGHSGQRTCVSEEDWKTPFGIVKNDSEFSKALGITIDNDAHMDEHSIEVQLPFLQFANKDKLKSIKIVPIIVNDTECVAEKIIRTAKKQKKKIIVIASSDFTHYGPNYGYLPFVSNVRDNLYKLDKGAIEKILKLDIEGFKKYVEKTEATICGFKPIIALIEYLKLSGAKNAKLLNYTTSGDVAGDFTNAVGYAAIAFY